MESVRRRMPWPEPDPGNTEPLLTREWLLTNGLGGYASGTVAGVATRRYHGLLIAAFPEPHGRTLMLNHLAEQVRLPNGAIVRFGGSQFADGTLDFHGAGNLKEFRLDNGVPVWRYAADDCVLEKQIVLVHLQNTVHIHYRLVEGEGTIRLWLRPSLHFRPHDAPVSTKLPARHVVTAVDGRYEISDGSGLPPLRLKLHGPHAGLTLETVRSPLILYRTEASRGYESTGELWSPGHFRIDLEQGRAGHARRVHGAVGDDRGAQPGRRLPGRVAALAAAHRGGAAGGRGPGWRGKWCWPPISSSSRRPAASRRRPAPARPATRCAASSPATTGSPTGAATP